MSAECGVCGAHGPYTVRPGNGHADWCPDVRAWLRSLETPQIVATRAFQANAAERRRKALAASPRGERAEGGVRSGEVAGAPSRAIREEAM